MLYRHCMLFVRNHGGTMVASAGCVVQMGLSNFVRSELSGTLTVAGVWQLQIDCCNGFPRRSHTKRHLSPIRWRCLARKVDSRCFGVDVSDRTSFLELSSVS